MWIHNGCEEIQLGHCKDETQTTTRDSDSDEMSGNKEDPGILLIEGKTFQNDE